MTFFF
jgi:vacuolar protein sorting-associated protein 13A/C